MEQFLSTLSAGGKKLSELSEYSVMIGLMSVLALMILPLPPFMLDLLLAINITISVLVLLTSVYVLRPLDFSVFPALLLITTLFRLGLNVASTRLILLGASQGTADAGNIIKTFGQFVVGGNSLVGIVVFLILVIINFMVITKGSGRIAEVAARFTLDALPGKQMSIDGEMASGAITEEEARKRRREVEREADFYGAMDGASKFVRGDAIAGLIITAINIIGGLVISMVQGGLGFGEATQTYTVLTVGDGLVSQIPALLISTAAGVIVTRAASDIQLNDELQIQLLGNERVLYGGGVTLAILGLIPGMPTLFFALLAAASIYLGWSLGQKNEEDEFIEEIDEAQAQEQEQEVLLEEAMNMELLTLEIGYDLIPLVDEKQGGTLVARLLQMRRGFARELGVLVPPIHIRDNLELSPGAYQLLLKGNPIAIGTLSPRKLLAIDPGNTFDNIDGTPTKDPTFGLDALWIGEDQRIRAESAGYTVVDLDTVITTHLSELVRQNASELLGWQELQDRLDLLRERSPKLVDELIPERLAFGHVLRVCRNLLDEQVSVRDLRTILEALAENAAHENSILQLTDHVRERLAPLISESLKSPDGQIYTAILSRELEDSLRQCIVAQHGEAVLACDLTTAQAMFAEIERTLPQFAMRDAVPTVLAPPDLRAPLKRFLSQFFPNVCVISHREVTANAQITSVGQLNWRPDVQHLAA